MNRMELINHFTDLHEAEIIALRRAIHEDPELSFKEYHTSGRVLLELDQMGIPYTKDIAGTGIRAVLKGNLPGSRTIGLRADMDALPLNEDTGLSFASKNCGVMHACGHDIHTANLVGVAKTLNDMKDSFGGTVCFYFQPAEENGGGGREMIKAGILEDPKPDAVMALHVMPGSPGIICSAPGDVSAFSDRLIVTVHGKKAHSSNPSSGVDAINIAAHIIVAYNSIVTRLLRPETVSTYNVGIIQGGTAGNIVADEVSIQIMLRNVHASDREIMLDRLKAIASGIAESFGGSCTFQFRAGYESVHNNAALTADMMTLFSENGNALTHGMENVSETRTHILSGTNLGAEDFGFYTQKVPGFMYWVGVGGNELPLHNSSVVFDESYIKLCTRSMVLGALHFLMD